MLNSKFVFHVGTLDQGFWPDGIYTPPTDEALQYDIKAHKEMGFNMIRKHVKVEMKRWYYHCDRLGILVWQDIPAVVKQHPQSSAGEFLDEAERIVKMLSFHPSIVLWTVYNEGWGQPSDELATAAITAKLRGIDPTRLINSLSGINFNAVKPNYDIGVGSSIDIHHYPEPGRVKYNDFRFSVAGEYGGISYYIKDHSWDFKRCHGYGPDVESADKLITAYQNYQNQVGEISEGDSYGISASVYTEITDVETECNGLLTYDRIFKVEARKIYNINKQLVDKYAERFQQTDTDTSTTDEHGLNRDPVTKESGLFELKFF
uniref:Glycoside hydrolase family 2 catalytic domain-containing protein n=2 Tax=Aplanochytrium stocchinoi TaxID=215587 RepID=A0A7S3LLK7_9STRA|mmetsp:Transcript_3385/g.4560  ORF Transcript_3385/g.4560 Transcript_3385/m.4560 type:complete len:318 (+) Transcript_3385:201-1154(+)